MDFRDFIVTPIILSLVYLFAYIIRPYVTDSITRRYFFPALTVRIIGAIAVGLVYQFYYSKIGGDTIMYHKYGSRIIWETFMQDPIQGIRLFFNDQSPDLAPISNQIYLYHEATSFAIVKISAFFDLFTFSTYSSTAIFFAIVSFFGSWFFFLTFYKLFPNLHGWLAVVSFFIPSVFFWGSGILKDTIIMSCLGFATYGIKRQLIDKKFSFVYLIILIFSLVLIFFIKKYVLLCFVPAALFWVYSGNLSRLKSGMMRTILLPLIIIVTFFTGLYAIQKIGEGDPRYAMDKIAKTAQITSYDIRFWSGKDAGSGYTLGELDGSFGSMLKLAPQAVVVSLFRPYLWEVKNPLMFLSALEAFILGLITTIVLIRNPGSFFRSLRNPNVLFCLVFAITFSFAVGVSTFNFGTLVRYKIPMMPFYCLALLIISDNSRKTNQLRASELK